MPLPREGNPVARGYVGNLGTRLEDNAGTAVADQTVSNELVMDAVGGAEHAARVEISVPELIAE
jgi:hypothetical protein